MSSLTQNYNMFIDGEGDRIGHWWMMGASFVLYWWFRRRRCHAVWASPEAATVEMADLVSSPVILPGGFCFPFSSPAGWRWQIPRLRSVLYFFVGIDLHACFASLRVAFFSGSAFSPSTMDSFSNWASLLLLGDVHFLWRTVRLS